MSAFTKVPERALLIAAMLAAAVCVLVFPVRLTADAAEPSAGTASWSELQEALKNAGPGGTVTLTADVAAEGSDTTLSITSGSVLTIDLNGHTIDRRAEENGTADSAVITVLPNAVLTVKDSSPGASGRITGGCSPDGGGIINVGTLIVEGGCITGNRSTDKGGGIGNYSLLVMSGGTVTANSADKRGGGIYNGVKGRMTLAEDMCGSRNN
ncbi:MAG: hypothetical protein IJR91_07245 [Ruminococcus sp.]|nr:hypothetical protein [Ruminococcus sp.]